MIRTFAEKPKATQQTTPVKSPKHCRSFVGQSRNVHSILHLQRTIGNEAVATRMACVKEIREDVLSKKGRYVDVKDNLKAKEVVIGDGMRRRRYTLCYNPREAKRSRKHREHLVELLESELSKHKDRDASAN